MRNLLVFIALFTVTISGIGVDLYSPSLPWIALSLQADPILVKYTVTTFLVGFALGQLFFGIASDRYGRKKTLMVGLVCFVLVSFAAVFSTHIAELILLRFMQGMAAASCSVVSKSLLTDTYTGKALHKAIASLTLAWGLGPVLAPVIGGYLQHHFDWQANFYFYATYSFVLLLLVIFFLKETLTAPVISTPAVIRGQYLRLIKHSAFLSGVTALGVSYSLLIAFNVMGPFLIQQQLHYSAVVFGHMAFIVGAAYCLGGLLNRLMLNFCQNIDLIRLGSYGLMIVGVIFVIATYYLPMSLLFIMIGTASIFIFMPFIFSNVAGLSMSFFPRFSGVSGSLMGCIIYLITTIFSIIFGVVPLHTLAPYAASLLVIIVMMAVLLLGVFLPSLRRLAADA